MSEYNPPPWHVTDDEYDDTVKAIVDDFNTPVAHVPKWAEEEDTAAAAAANARLIAAAPAMYETLEQIARFNKDGETVDGIIFEMSIDDAFETINSIIGLARSTIKKVKNRQKVIDLDPAGN